MPSQKPARLKRKDALVDELFAAATLMPGEDADAYEALQKSFVQSIQPRNTLERALVLEVAAKTWEILRLQGYRKHVIKSALADAVVDMLGPAYTVGGPVLGVKAAWLDGDPKIVAAVQQHLKRHKLGPQHLNARAYVIATPALDGIDQHILQLEQSRSRALKNIAQLDAILSKRLAEDMKTIEGKFHRDDGPTLPPPVLAEP